MGPLFDDGIELAEESRVLGEGTGRWGKGCRSANREALDWGVDVGEEASPWRGVILEDFLLGFFSWEGI